MQESVIQDLQLDAERALYNLQNAEVRRCVFAGSADGESALKEARNIRMADCSFSLRYPLWHVNGFTLEHIEMDRFTRAALWYSFHGKIENSTLGGIKALRECGDIALSHCTIESPEFGWKCADITVENSEITAEYLFLDSRDIRLKNVAMHGKYSFQYVDGLFIEDSVLDTKDAFWHTRNVTVKNSVIKGEYLAWFSQGLTLIDCEIEGTQPLCYCKDLTLVNCTMKNCDLSFEYSDVHAEVRGHIDSVKNPRSGRIAANSIGEIINGDAVMECSCEVVIREEEKQ